MATTEKMLPPGMMPGKDEIDKYTRLYADPDFSLSGWIESFDSSVLSEDYERAFCKRYPYYTLVGNDEDVKGWEWDPLVHRTDLMKISHRGDMEEFFYSYRLKGLPGLSEKSDSSFHFRRIGKAETGLQKTGRRKKQRMEKAAGKAGILLSDIVQRS